MCRRDLQGGTAGPRPSPGPTACVPAVDTGHYGTPPLCPPTPPSLLALNQGWRGHSQDGVIPQLAGGAGGQPGAHEAAARWSQIPPPQGPGLPPEQWRRPRGQASSLGGGQTLGCHCCCVCWPRGRGAAGRTQRPPLLGRCQGLGRLRPQRVPAAVPGLRWPSTCALRSSSGYKCLGGHRGLSWVRPRPPLPPPRLQNVPEQPRPGASTWECAQTPEGRERNQPGGQGGPA